MSKIYSHPYITIQIYDDTEYAEEDTSTSVRQAFNGMQVGFFAGGRDNQLLYIDNRTQFLREYGNPNFKKFGQAAYNVDAALSTGNCGMYVMNLRPTTATYANVVIMVRFKVVKPEETTGEGDGTDTDLPDQTTPVEPTEPTKLVYSFYANYFEGCNTVDRLAMNALGLMETDPDENGFYNMPLMLIYTLGRGEYGNNIRLKFENVSEYDPEYEDSSVNIHTYTLSVMEPTTSGLSVREVNYGTLDEDAFDPTIEYGPSLFLQDTINDVEDGSQRINVEFYSATINTILTLYNTEVAPDAPLEAGSLDLITRFNLDGTTNTLLELDTTTLEEPDYNVNLLALDGFVLQGGDDGWSGMSEEEVEDAKNALLISAYAGELDPVIKSRFSSPCDFSLDANYDVEVKRQMAALATYRQYDCMTYLDSNLISTVSGLTTYLASIKSIYGFNIVKECHCYKWRDTTYTGKVCSMTITHWLASALPNHMANAYRGLGLPMARDVAVLRSKTDYIPGSFKPVIEPNDECKETIYRLRANCYQTLTYNSVHRSTAITSCQTNSDRLLEMNEYIVQRAVRVAYDILSSKIYKLGEESDRANYESTATDVINDELAGYVKEVSVSFEMTNSDRKKSLLRLNLHIVFKTVIQNGEINIYLDPRVVDTVTVS